jgi:signal transduction histidine kinase
MLAVANKNSDRLAMLIDDLLDLQALDTGKMAMNVKPMDLSTLLRDAIEATAGYLRDKNVSLILVGSHPPVMVNGDEKRLMQVMANVLSNAIKFSKDGGIVQVRLETHEDLATVSVRDNGRGIPPGSEQTVFGEFSQIDSSDVRSVGGSGLGMSISRRILLLHKGTIGYESEVGVGTNFIITLPVFSAPIEVQGQGRPGSRGAAGAVETVPI